MCQHQVKYTLSIPSLVLHTHIFYTPSLYQHNNSFLEAKDGKEAFERVAEAATSLRLIITDIQMPVCNGFDFARKVRRQLLELVRQILRHPLYRTC